MYVSIYVCMYVCMYLYKYISIFIDTYISNYKYKYIYIYTPENQSNLTPSEAIDGQRPGGALLPSWHSAGVLEASEHVGGRGRNTIHLQYPLVN